ncbi:sodium/hydrogen exchanger [Oleiphilus messinensis]|uniref:Sodium/hydrogen exchanger n=1 Tax=Oleiphilus messinensis TaxID=141451 RepID=A0A1Y0IDW9_9GAMM|nr:cation:proton antiporter [Oleiphilus messinensis]ARU58641.1 sodium/hydrogen exchanger [Oleiphilus messinensis]
MNTDDYPAMLVVGALLLVGWIAHTAGKRVHIPRVTILLIVGVISGPAVLDLIPSSIADWFVHVTHVALAMVGFLLGGSFTRKEMKATGKVVLAVSIGETLGAAVAVFLVALLCQLDLVTALLLAGIAPASAPAATLDVIRENHAHGPLAKTVLGVVAIDDTWGVILFSLLLAFAEAIRGHGDPLHELATACWELGGAIGLGVILGIPMAWCTGRLNKGEPTVLEAAGFVLLCGGLAVWLDVSYLLACMTLGAMVANFAKHHKRSFRDIEGASEPFLVIFFLLAGYALEFSALLTLGVVGGAYIIARSFGLIVGGSVSARMVNAAPQIQRHIGWCLLPQAGVALGLALLVAERIPDVGAQILTLIIATTVVFELVSPSITRRHLKLAGEGL